MTEGEENEAKFRGRGGGNRAVFVAESWPFIWAKGAFTEAGGWERGAGAVCPLKRRETETALGATAGGLRSPLPRCAESPGVGGVVPAGPSWHGPTQPGSYRSRAPSWTPVSCRRGRPFRVPSSLPVRCCPCPALPPLRGSSAGFVKSHPTSWLPRPGPDTPKSCL